MHHGKHHAHHGHRGYHGGLLFMLLAVIPGAAGLLICLDAFVLGGPAMFIPPALAAVSWLCYQASRPRPPPRW